MRLVCFPPRRTAGFSLLELMVVVTIVAIVTAIALPVYSNYVLRTKVKVAGADLSALTAVVENQRQRTLNYPDQAGVEQFSQWRPSSDSSEFSFDYAPSDEGYVVSARWTQEGKLSGCELTLDQRHEKTASDTCMVNDQWR